MCYHIEFSKIKQREKLALFKFYKINLVALHLGLIRLAHSTWVLSILVFQEIGEYVCPWRRFKNDQVFYFLSKPYFRIRNSFLAVHVAYYLPH